MAENIQFRVWRERELENILLQEAAEELRPRPRFAKKKLVMLRKKNGHKAEVKFVPKPRDEATKAWILASHAYHAHLIAEAVKELRELRRSGKELAS